MILHAIRLENWRCIAGLELENLPPGITVLHGPNRTGKTSLVKALRCCLYEYDHDTAAKKFKPNLSWGANQAPKVNVEFETGGERYRLAKVFSTRADGNAVLEKQVSGRWLDQKLAPKEASRKTLELLGFDRPDSHSGLNQLLWIDQGTIALPESGKLDPSLEGRLMNVLGMLVTGRDQEFKRALDKRWERWYTPKGRLKETSEVSRLEKMRLERKQARDEEEARFVEVEGAIRELEALEDQLPALRQQVATATNELKQFQQEREDGRERRQQYQRIQRDCQTAEKALGEARQKLESFQDAKNRCQKSLDAVREMEPKVQAAREKKDRLADEQTRREGELEEDRKTEEAQQRGQDEIEDRRKLLDMATESSATRQLLDRVREKEAEIANRERQVRELMAPDKSVLDDLQENRRQAGKLRAQLDAAALTLAVETRGIAAVELVVDGQPAQTVQLQAQEKRSWSLHQQVSLAIPGWGKVELARARDRTDLGEAAGQLAELDRSFHDTVQLYGEDPTQEACQDRLLERRLEKETTAKRLAELREELKRLVPHGSQVLSDALTEFEGQRQIICKRRPSLADWQPTREELETLEKEHRARIADRKTARQKREVLVKETADLHRKAEKTWRELSEQFAATKATCKSLQEELQRLGDESACQQAAAQADKEWRKLQKCMADAQLTEAEKTIEDRLASSEASLRNRETRLRQAEDDITRLRGRLEGSEGLHIKRADAATALLEVERQLEREQLEADAHRRLRDLFEQCRDQQVQQVTGPIAKRVLDWACFLGLDNFREVRFGERFLPEGVVLRGNDQELIKLDEESYGTVEQLSLLIRLALGGVLACHEPQVVVLDDPLAHADPGKHRKILEVIKMACEGNVGGDPPAGRLQILILTCHPDRFDHLPTACHIDLSRRVRRHADSGPA